MGMAASQARYLALVERNNDLEYQGQQINQQRTTLSDQVNALYNSLLVMNVPTPPSTADYTKVVYSGALGSSTFSIGNITPVGTEYNVTLNYKKTGHYVEAAGTTAIVAAEPKIKLAKLEENNYKEPDITGYKCGEAYNDSSNWTSFMQRTDGKSVTSGKYYTLANGIFTEHDYIQTHPANDAVVYVIANGAPKEGDYSYVDFDNNNQADTITGAYKAISGQPSDYYIIENGTSRQATANDFDEIKGKYYFKNLNSSASYAKADANGNDGEIANPYYDVDRPATVKGANVMTLDQAKKENRISEETLDNYKQALFNAHPELGKSVDEVADKFYIYYTSENGANVPHFILKTDVTMGLTDENKTSWAEYSDFMANGKYTEAKEEKGCKLEFDADGRISAISIPITTADGNISYKTVRLEAATVTDDKAYEDAYNQYEYQKHLYDQEQNEINAKTSVIQAQDKKLELKLTRLDNERKAIQAELEAIKKVIGENIDKGFKTFSG